MAEWKTTCKEPWNQDLTDHRALREQLHTIRTASLEERHGSGKRLESGEKCDRNGEPFYTTTLQMHYNALTLTSNSLTEREYWFFDSDSSSNQSVQSRRCVWILLVMVASASSLHIQLLSSNYSVYFNSYIPTHHQDLHIRSQRAKQKTNHMKYHAPQMATGSKTNIETSWNSSNKHPSDMFSGRKKTNEIHMLYRCSSQFCKDLIRHI